MYQMSSLDQRIFDSSHVRSSDVSLDHHLVLTCHWSHILQVSSFILVSRSILLRPPQTQAISPKICFFFCMVWLRPKSRKRRFPVPFPATVRPILTGARNEIPKNGYRWTKQRNFYIVSGKKVRFCSQKRGLVSGCKISGRN